MSTPHEKALKSKKEGIYAFLTNRSFRVEAKGKSAKEAYPTARSIVKHYSKKGPEPLKGDRLTGTYFKYDKEGLHSNEGPYSQHRPSRFRKNTK